MSEYYIHLHGDHWASRSAGYLAVEIITGLVLITCLFFVRSFKWVSKGYTDSFRTYVLVTSIVATIIYFILDLSNLGEEEKNDVLTFKYYILYLFTELFYRIGEFALLVVAARSAAHLASSSLSSSSSDALSPSPSVPQPRLRLTERVLLGLVGLVSLTTFALVAAYYGGAANQDLDVPGRLAGPIVGFFVTYNALYAVAAGFILGVAILGAVRGRSKPAFLMVIVAGCLLLRSVVYLADLVVVYYTHFSRDRFNFDWANSFIYNVMVVVIYAGLTGLATIGSGFTQMQKHDPGLELTPFASPHVY